MKNTDWREEDAWINRTIKSTVEGQPERVSYLITLVDPDEKWLFIPVKAFNPDDAIVTVHAKYDSKFRPTKDGDMFVRPYKIIECRLNDRVGSSGSGNEGVAA